MSREPASVCACVLSFNRPALLVEAVRALLGQSRPPARVVVVDNASAEPVEQSLAAAGLLERIEFHRLERNLGGAGGYGELVDRALAGGNEDWLWLMDDDAEPAHDALERLLDAPRAADPGTAVLCGSVRTPAGDLELLHRGHLRRFMRVLPQSAYRDGEYPELGFASFVGFMVRSRVALAVGLPRAEFFIGCDDVDYSLRVRRHGRIVLVPESEIRHKLGMGGGTETRRSGLWNRILGEGYTSASWESFWKNLYAIRNFIWIKHHYGSISPLAFAGITAAYVAKTLMYDATPLRRIPWIVRFALKGRRGDFSAPSPAEWRELARAG